MFGADTTKPTMLAWYGGGSKCLHLKGSRRPLEDSPTYYVTRGIFTDPEAAAEDDEAVGGMRRPALSLLKVPVLIQMGHKLGDDIVSALVDHNEPERLELMLTRIRDALLEALGSRSTHSIGRKVQMDLIEAVVAGSGDPEVHMAEWLSQGAS
eukprot:3491767-Amphidinium_carterae.3